MTDTFPTQPILPQEDKVSRAPRRRGPRSQLEDAQLHNRRDQLVHTFENAWGNIGWELRTCKKKKADNLVGIFSPLAEGYIRDIVSVFGHTSEERRSPTVLRKIRAELRVVVEKRYKAEQSYREYLDQLQQADWALAQAARGEQRLVKRERKKRRKRFAKAAQTMRTLSERERSLETQRRDLEAIFARREILRFLKSERYELTPLNLANATAGLPFMGWRRSMQRCKKPKSKIADGLVYQIFKSIRYLIGTASNKTENLLVAHFHEEIPSLPTRYRLAKTELAGKWWYLEPAIRQAVRTKPHPKALPFEIMKRYLRQMRSQSLVEMVLAQGAKLTLDK